MDGTRRQEGIGKNSMGMCFTVLPAQAGIQILAFGEVDWIPASAGMTDLYDWIPFLSSVMR